MRVNFKRLLTVAVVALGIAASSAGAGNTNNPKADIQQGNGFCGADVPTLPVIGFVNYHRSADGATVSVNVHVKGAPAGTTYYVLLYNGDNCFYIGGYPDNAITTNSNGVANANLDFTVDPSTTGFFASLYQPGPFIFSDTPVVTLTP